MTIREFIDEGTSGGSGGGGTGGGSSSTPVIDREIPDSVPDRFVSQEESNVLASIVPLSVEEGKLYYVLFNTERDIRINTPKELSLAGYGIIITEVLKPTPKTLKVIYKVL